MKSLKELIDKLDEYGTKGSFRFSPEDELAQVCNIPARRDISGIYLIYNQLSEMIYVGISGREAADGEVIHRKDGLRGRFLSGKQFGGRRSKTLPKQIIAEGYDHLIIKWFVTYGEDSQDNPRPLEREIIQAYKRENLGKRPKWNKKD